MWIEFVHNKFKTTATATSGFKYNFALHGFNLCHFGYSMPVELKSVLVHDVRYMTLLDIDQTISGFIQIGPTYVQTVQLVFFVV
jgi:hypothetical protein